jgi:hypothetical protein
VSESTVSAKRGWGLFGAKPARSETPVRAAAKRRPPGRGRSGRKMRSLLLGFLYQDSAMTEWNASSLATMKWRPAASENSLLGKGGFVLLILFTTDREQHSRMVGNRKRVLCSAVLKPFALRGKTPPLAHRVGRGGDFACVEWHQIRLYV